MNINVMRRRIHKVVPRPSPFSFEYDLPGPYKLEWSTRTAGERIIHMREHPIPVLTGITFAAAPYVLGSAMIAFGPHPAIKAAGVSMVIPTGVGEAFWFTVGYGFGMQIEEEVESWF